MGKSYQKGYVALRGQKWYGYFRKTVLAPATEEERPVRVAVILGQKSQMTRSEARESLEKEITKRLGQAGNGARVMNDGSVTFDWFVRKSPPAS